jgi:isoleucyl-tRNA synthetase
VENLKDLHRPYIDEIELSCKCGHGKMKRIPEVFDCWVESASMPFAELHYPFENQKIFEERYPADFIAEYVGQVRAWFNVLHRLAVGLFDKPSFKNVVVTGVYLGSDGKKMSKSKKNYPDPALVFEKYGVDAVRFYMMSTTVMKGENVILTEKDVDEVYKKVMNIFWNVHSFLMMYGGASIKPTNNAVHVMDKWVLSLTNSTLKKVTEFMDAYDVVSACREIHSFIDLVSTWYLRRSRDRIKEDAVSAGVLGWVLQVTAQMLAPITPFMSEVVYSDLTQAESVHLSDWPVFDQSKIDPELEKEMEEVKSVVEFGHSERKAKEIKVRQPLAKITVSQKGLKLSNELVEILKEELNVKSVEIKDSGAVISVELDTKITEDLELEGIARDLVRSIQVLRKEKGMSVTDVVNIEYESNEKTKKAVATFEDYIKQKASVEKLV